MNTPEPSIGQPAIPPVNEPGISGGYSSSEQGGIKEGIHKAGETLRTKASETANRLRTKGESVAASKKSTVAERINDYGSAVRRAAETLGQEQDPNLAYYANLMADRLEHVSSYIRDRDLEGLRQDTEQWVREHPAVVFGGLFVAGLFIGRFLKAEAEMEAESHGIAS